MHSQGWTFAAVLIALLPTPLPVIAQGQPGHTATVVEGQKLAKPFPASAAADAPVDAAGRERWKAGWSFRADNDAYSLTDRDRDYTGGETLTLAGRRAAEWWLSADPALGVIDAALGVGQGDEVQTPGRFHALQFGTAAFAPDDQDSRAVVRGDRPYASVLFLSNGRLYLHDDATRIDQSSLLLGFLGLEVAERTQDLIHSALSLDEVRGWHHQISDGGEPTLLYARSQQRLLWSDVRRQGSRYQLKTGLSGSLGAITEAGVGASFRWGRINTPWWSFGSGRIAYFDQPAPVIGQSTRDPQRELYIGGGVKLSARPWNVLLQGQFRDSDLRYDFDEIRPLVVEGWLGITAQISRRYRLSWVLTAQSSELRAEPGDRETVWAGITLSRAVD